MYLWGTCTLFVTNVSGVVITDGNFIVTCSINILQLYGAVGIFFETSHANAATC
jgi:hypothetical protein